MPQSTSSSRTRALFGSAHFYAILPAATVLSLLIACVLRSAGKQEWVDEIYTRTEVTDPSIRHLFHALQSIGGAGMPLFYLTAWPWAHFIGSSDLALRLYSSVAICAALLVLWKILRHYWPAPAVAAGILTVWCASATIAYQNSDARCYGLYLLVATLAVAAWMRVAQEQTPSRLTLLLLTLSQAALVLNHILGIAYGMLMLAALIFFDATRPDRPARRFRLKTYVCHAAGWLTLLVWIPAIRISLDAGKPYGWIKTPTPSDILFEFYFSLFRQILVPLYRASHVFAGFVGVVFSFTIVAIIISECRAISRPAPHPTALATARRALIVVAVSLLLAPLFFFVISLTIAPIWIERYMMPTIVGLTIVLVSFANRHLSHFNRWPDAVAAWSVCMICLSILTALGITPDQLHENPLRLDVAHIDAVSTATGLPIVYGWENDFFVMLRYSHQPQRSFYLLDWDTALRGSQDAPTNYHMLKEYREQGYYTANILDQNQFLCTHQDFLALEDTEAPWFHLSFSDPRQYSIRSATRIDSTRTLFAVHRDVPLASCTQ